MSRSRLLKLYYFEYVGHIDGTKVKVFISKRDVNGGPAIIITNTELSFKKALGIYSTRWTIEVFFKDIKQDYQEYKLKSKAAIGNSGYLRAFGFTNRGYRH